MLAIVSSAGCWSESSGLNVARVDGGDAGDANGDARTDTPRPLSDAREEAGEAGEAGSEAGGPEVSCTPNELRCAPVGAAAVERCQAGTWLTTEACPFGCGSGKCLACMPTARRCAADGKAVEACAADGSAYAAGESCASGCQAGRCNVCVPGTAMCSGLNLRTCRADGSGTDEVTCPAPAGGTATCMADRCDFTCAAGRTKTSTAMGNTCACPAANFDCGGTCMPSSQVIEVPPFEKKCAAPFGETCDAYNHPVAIPGCARKVSITLRAEREHCAPIFVQVLVNGMPRGMRTAAIPPDGTSAPIDLGTLGPGQVTLGFVATVARSGCGVGGLISSWGGSARLTLTAP